MNDAKLHLVGSEKAPILETDELSVLRAEVEKLTSYVAKVRHDSFVEGWEAGYADGYTKARKGRGA